MILKEILETMIREKNPVLLCDSQGEWKPRDLLATLSDIRLKTPAHHQPGMYIAEVNASGYMGSIMYRIKSAS
jgi:hypothetical protein